MFKWIFFLGIFFQSYALDNVAEMVWYHESNHQPERLDLLTFWNEKEPFPSIGIGHFIWPPESYEGAFSSGRFHRFIQFAIERGADVPDWLREARYCPWESREEFYAAQASEKMQEFQTFVQDTMDLQAAYMTQRLERFKERLLNEGYTQEYEKLMGIDVAILVDYLNFKHEGFDPKERYQGQGWGLFQVLQKMNGFDSNAFADAAKILLIKRVANAPDPISESWWIPIWFERLDSYR